MIPGLTALTNYISRKSLPRDYTYGGAFTNALADLELGMRQLLKRVIVSKSVSVPVFVNVGS